jgi:hypothetical protein
MARAFAFIAKVGDGLIPLTRSDTDIFSSFD